MRGNGVRLAHLCDVGPFEVTLSSSVRASQYSQFVYSGRVE